MNENYPPESFKWLTWTNTRARNMGSQLTWACVNQQCCGHGHCVTTRLATYGRTERMNISRKTGGGFLPASPPLEKKTANTGRELAKVHSVGLELWVSL